MHGVDRSEELPRRARLRRTLCVAVPSGEFVAWVDTTESEFDDPDMSTARFSIMDLRTQFMRLRQRPPFPESGLEPLCFASADAQSVRAHASRLAVPASRSIVEHGIAFATISRPVSAGRLQSGAVFQPRGMSMGNRRLAA